MDMTLTHASLLQHLHYDPATGIFTRKVRTSQNTRIGDVAGYINRAGYIIVGLFGRSYLAHRLAWFYMHGQWPARNLDHRDRSRLNNRIDNLRECNQAQNMANISKPSKGVSRMPPRKGKVRPKPWRARFSAKTIGYFATKEEAKAAYDAYASALHGEFSCP